MSDREDIKTVIDEYASHQKLLTKYALMAPEHTTIVELGCGYYSSPILSNICQSKNIHYHIFYAFDQWANNIKPLVYAEFHKINNWEDLDIPGCYLCFVDQEELVINRYKRWEVVIPKCKFLICHDYNIYFERGLHPDSDYELIEVDESYPNCPSTACFRGEL